MSLLLPLFIAAGGLIALPIILHLLRRKPVDRVPFPTLRFLGQLALRDTRRQELLRWLTLLARCLIILLVALAFSRPYWPRARDANRRAVIVAVDNSFSMQATGRREAVDNWLNKELAALRPGDELGVLQLQPTPIWLAPLSENIEVGRTALKNRVDGYETSNYAPGLSLAAAVLDQTPAAERAIIIAGDEQNLAWANVDFKHRLPAGIDLQTAPPAPLPNAQAAISNLRVTRIPGNQIRMEVTIRVLAPHKAQHTISFYANNRLVGTSTGELTAGLSDTMSSDFPAPIATSDIAFRATIDHDDLEADNTTYAVLPPDDSRHVLLAPPTANEVDFLSHALAAVHGNGLPTLLVNPLPLNAAAWPIGTVAVLRGAAPFRDNNAAALDKFLAAGGAAWVLGDGSPEQVAWLARHGVTVTPVHPVADGESLRLRDFDLDHPLFAPFAGRSLAPLLEAEFQAGWALSGEAVEPLAHWSDHSVAVAEVHATNGRLLVTGFADRRVDANWPLQSAFVPFAHHAIVWLGDNRPSQSQTGRVGQRLNLPGPGSWKSVDAPRATPSREVGASITPDVPGIYEFHTPGLTRLFAVNVDPEESNLASRPAEDLAKLVSPEPRAPEQVAALSVAALPLDHNNTQIWWWLLAAAVLLLGFELSVANRTVP